MSAFHPLKTVGVAAALGALGCLPDPRVYDPCIDQQGYYSMPPTGCGRHDLTILDERLNDSAFFAMLDPSRRRLAVDDNNVYWADAEGAVLLTPKQGGPTEELATCDNPETIELQISGGEVYVQCSGAFSQTLTAINQATRAIRVVATLLSAEPISIRVHDGYYYATQSSPSPCVLRGSTAGDEAAACYIEAHLVDFDLNDTGLYGVLAIGGLVFYPNDNSVGQAVVSIPQATSPVVIAFDELDEQHAYYTRCAQNGTTENTCARVQVTLDPVRFGASTTLVDDLGYNACVRNDGNNTFVVTSGTPDDLWTTARLLAYRPGSSDPQVLAASMDTTYGLALDTDFVYALVVDSAEEGQRMRLVRVER